MSDADLLNAWFIGLGVTAVVVVIAAALRLAMVSGRRGVERGVMASIGLVKQIRENRQIIWALEDANRVARQLSAGADSILGHAGAIAQGLHEAYIGRWRTGA